jgi:hypothetical protein
MLRSLERLTAYTLKTKDGFEGRPVNFYFDENSWAVRYALLETTRGPLLLEPCSFETIDSDAKIFTAQLDSPKKAVIFLGQREVDLRQYDSALHPAEPSSGYGAAMLGVMEDDLRISDSAGSYMKTLNDIKGLTVRAMDDEAGSVEDLITDQKWAVRYLLLNTEGEKRLVSIDAVSKMDWVDARIFVRMTIEQLRQSPHPHIKDILHYKNEVELEDYYAQFKLSA